MLSAFESTALRTFGPNKRRPSRRRARRNPVSENVKWSLITIGGLGAVGLLTWALTREGTAAGSTSSPSSGSSSAGGSSSGGSVPPGNPPASTWTALVAPWTFTAGKQYLISIPAGLGAAAVAILPTLGVASNAFQTTVAGTPIAGEPAGDGSATNTRITFTAGTTVTLNPVVQATLVGVQAYQLG